MSDTASQTIAKVRQWPLTSNARSQLIEEIARVREDLSSLTGQGLEEGIVRLPVAMAARRLEVLKDVLDRAELAEGMQCAAIGRRATLRDDGGESMTYEIVFRAMVTRPGAAYRQTRLSAGRSSVRTRATSSKSGLQLGSGR